MGNVVDMTISLIRKECEKEFENFNHEQNKITVGLARADERNKASEHINRLERCSGCGKIFYDKHCPDCIRGFEYRRVNKMIEEISNMRLMKKAIAQGQQGFLDGWNNCIDFILEKFKKKEVG
jgi:hypothetical protein